MSQPRLISIPRDFVIALSKVSPAGLPQLPILRRLREVGITFEGDKMVVLGCDAIEETALEQYASKLAGDNTASDINGVEDGLKNLLTKVQTTTGPAPSQQAPPSVSDRGDAPPMFGGSAELKSPLTDDCGANSPSVSQTATALSAQPEASTPAIALPEAAPVRPQAATWQENDPTEPWCPEAIWPHLGFTDFNYKNNYSQEGPASPGWQIVAATRRGRMHAHKGTHREDAFHLAAENSFTIACVCDGAGSYKYSRIGSETTCRQTVNYLHEALRGRVDELASLTPEKLGEEMGKLIVAAVENACQFLRELAVKSSLEPKDFRCTLVCGVLWLAGDSPYLFFSQVGDGFMAGSNKDGTAKRYGASDSGAFSGEVNCFVPDENAPENARKIPQIVATNHDAFIFCSDGIEDPFFPIERNAAVIFAQLRDGVKDPLPGFGKQLPTGPVIGAPDASAQLESWLAFEKKGENDDRTILVLHRTKAAQEARIAPDAELQSSVAPPSRPEQTTESSFDPPAPNQGVNAPSSASPPSRKGGVVGVSIFLAVVVVALVSMFSNRADQRHRGRRDITDHRRPANSPSPDALVVPAADPAPEKAVPNMAGTPAQAKQIAAETVKEPIAPPDPGPPPNLSSGKAQNNEPPEE